eukprot:4147199-Prymnesium_polylepis.1
MGNYTPRLRRAVSVPFALVGRVTSDAQDPDFGAISLAAESDIADSGTSAQWARLRSSLLSRHNPTSSPPQSEGGSARGSLPDCDSAKEGPTREGTDVPAALPA